MCCQVLLNHMFGEHHVSVHFSQTCPGASRHTICATLAYLVSFSVKPRLHLLPLQLQGSHVRARVTGLMHLQRGARVLYAVRLQLGHQRGRRQRADRLRLLWPHRVRESARSPAEKLTVLLQMGVRWGMQLPSLHLIKCCCSYFLRRLPLRATHTRTHTHIHTHAKSLLFEKFAAARNTHTYTLHTYTYTHTNARTHKHTHRCVSRLHSNSSSRAFPNLASAAKAAAVSGRISPKYIYVYIHINMYICSSSSRHSQSLYIYIYIYIHTNIHISSSSSRNLANSSRRVAARQHALLRSPVFILPTLPAVFSRTCHLMTHCSNLTWWALFCRCDFLPVSCNGSKLKAGNITHLKGGGVR